MYKIISAEYHYFPYVILELQNCVTGEIGLWLSTEVWSDGLCEQYHTTHLVGIVMDELPDHGSWITKEELAKLP